MENIDRIEVMRLIFGISFAGLDMLSEPYYLNNIIILNGKE